MIKQLSVLCALVTGAGLAVPDARADTLVRTARYTTVAPVATPAQADLLHVIVRIQFPGHVTTVRDAFGHLLSRSGYRLAPDGSADPRRDILLRSPLPAVHRQLGPITLQGALETLAGPAWVLVTDPVHRLVSFELAAPYAGGVQP